MKTSDEGYAALGAIAVCAAISVMCAALLSAASAQRQQGQRELLSLQREEAMHTAVLRMATRLARSQGTQTHIEQEVVDTPLGNLTVELRAEHEGRKWPLSKLAEVKDANLAAYTSLRRDELAALAGEKDEPKDDCLRSLFSPYGANDPAKKFPATVSVLSMSSGHDGEVWRIRAVSGGRLQERRVRFLGDPDHLFAVVSLEDYALGEMKTCNQISARP